MKKSHASAKWRGNLWEGSGNIKLPTINQELSFSASSRFQQAEASKTDPEELIAAAHSGCFSMAFANVLASKGFPPNLISTEATVTMDKVENGFKIMKSELKTRAEVPGISAELFQELAQTAKKNCPVSVALASIEITLDAKLV